jgi:hypothetical protein
MMAMLASSILVEQRSADSAGFSSSGPSAGRSGVECHPARCPEDPDRTALIDVPTSPSSGSVPTGAPRFRADCDVLICILGVSACIYHNFIRYWAEA